MGFLPFTPEASATFFSLTPSASIVVLGIDESASAVDKEVKEEESSPIESSPACPLPNGKNPIFFTLSTARYFLSLHPPPINMKRFVLTLFFGVFCVYFECAQEKRACVCVCVCACV